MTRRNLAGRLSAAEEALRKAQLRRRAYPTVGETAQEREKQLREFMGDSFDLDGADFERIQFTYTGFNHNRQPSGVRIIQGPLGVR